MVSSSTFDQKVVKRKSEDPLKLLPNRVASKLEDGYFKGAVTFASGDDTLTEHSTAILEALKRKHPGTCISNTPNLNLSSFCLATYARVVSTS